MKKCGHCDGLGLVQAESRELVADVGGLRIVKRVCKACHGEGIFNVEE